MSDLDKFREQLTDYEREMLLRLMQASAEVGVSTSKVLRYGKDDCPPDRASTIPVNSVTLALDIGNLLATALLLVDCGLMEISYINAGVKRTTLRLPRYLQTRLPHD